MKPGKLNRLVDRFGKGTRRFRPVAPRKRLRSEINTVTLAEREKRMDEVVHRESRLKREMPLLDIIENANANSEFVNDPDVKFRLSGIFSNSPAHKLEFDTVIGQMAVTAAVGKIKLKDIFIHEDPKKWVAEFFDGESPEHHIIDRFLSAFRVEDDKIFLRPYTIAFIRNRCKEHGIDIE